MEVALKGLRSRGYVPEVVFDIGASNGSWSRMALKVWPSARYVLFEPLAEHRHELDKLALEHPNVSVRPVGLGDQDCKLPLGVTSSLWDSSFAYAGSTAREVECRRIDSMVRAEEVPLPSFIKMDVQGFEPRVMNGASESATRADFILLECTFFAFCPEMTTLDVLIAFMAARNFIPYEFVDFLRRPLDGAMGQCDILFARRGHTLVSDWRWSA
jgi:FkbM family methyltransferase